MHEQRSKPKKRRPALSSMAEDAARSYCLSTSIHGLSYVASGSGTKEKLFWFVTVASGLLCGGMMVSAAFKGWAANPVLTAIHTFGFPIERIQYPTITICKGTGDDPWDYTRNHLNACEEDADCMKSIEELMSKLNDQVKYQYFKVLYMTLDRLKSGVETLFVSPNVLKLINLAVAPLVVGDFGNALKISDLMTSLAVGNETQQKRQEILKMLSLQMNDRDEMGWHGWIRRKQSAMGAERPGLSNLYMLTQLAKEEESWMGIGECIENATVDHSYQFRNKTRNCILDKNGNSSRSYVAVAAGIVANHSVYEACVLKICLRVAYFRTNYFCNHVYDIFDARKICERCKCPTGPDRIEDIAKKIALALLIPDKRDMGNYVEGFTKMGMAESRSSSSMFDLWYPLLGWKSDVVNQSLTPVEVALMFHKVSQSDFNVTEVSFGPDLVKLLKYSLYKARSTGITHAKNSGSIGILHGDNGDFVPNYTDDGICLVSNGPSLQNAYNIDDRMATVASILNMNKEDHPPMRNNTGSGRYVTKMFWLDARSFGTDGEMGFATVGINSFLDFFSVDSVAVEAIAGHNTVVKVRTMLHAATHDLRTLDLVLRQCRFTDELDGSVTIFKYYTQQACLFECKLKFAIEKVNCTPWDFPKPKGSPAEICTNINDKTFLFRENMRAMPHDNCDCLPNCEEVEFDVEVNTPHADSAKLCANPRGEERKMALEFFRQHYDIRQWRFSALLSEEVLTILDEPFADKELQLFEYEVVRICREVIDNDLAKLTLRIPKPRITVSNKMRRFTFADQLGTLGGTMGLFCGLSLISLVEVAYWIYKVILRLGQH